MRITTTPLSLAAKTLPPLLVLLTIALVLSGCSRGSSAASRSSSTSLTSSSTSSASTRSLAQAGASTGPISKPTKGAVVKKRLKRRSHLPSQVKTRLVHLRPTHGSGVRGIAEFARIRDGVEVALALSGLKGSAGTAHPAYIRQGTCSEDQKGEGGSIEYFLNPVIGGNGGSGASTTILKGVHLVSLFRGPSPQYINVHAGLQGSRVLPSIACANLTSAK